MRCEEARARYGAGDYSGFDSHLESCAACFAWAESSDPLVSLLKDARPSPQAVPARVSSAVLSAWNPAVISRRLVAAAAVTLVIAGLAGLAISATLLPGVFIALAGTATSALAAVYGPPLAVIGVAGSLLFDNPAWLAVFAVITGLVCLLWIRLFTGLQFRREVIQ